MTTGKPCSAPSVPPAATAASVASAPILAFSTANVTMTLSLGSRVSMARVRVQYFYSSLPRSDEAYEFDRGAVVRASQLTCALRDAGGRNLFPDVDDGDNWSAAPGLCMHRIYRDEDRWIADRRSLRRRPRRPSSGGDGGRRNCRAWISRRPPNAPRFAFDEAIDHPCLLLRTAGCRVFSIRHCEWRHKCRRCRGASRITLFLILNLAACALLKIE